MSFSPDETILAGIVSSQLRLWETKTGQEVSIPEKMPKGVKNLEFSPEGTRLAVGHLDGTVTVLNPFRPEIVFTRQAHEIGPAVVAYRFDGNHIATGGRDGFVRIWDAVSGECLRQLHSPRDLVTSVAYSPDGKRVFTGTIEGKVKIWVPETVSELFTLGGSTTNIRSLAFTADGYRLVSDYGLGILIYDGTPWGQKPAPLPKLE